MSTNPPPADQRYSGHFLGEVTALTMVNGTPRFEVKLHAMPSDTPFIARITQPFTGNNRGAWLLPQLHDEVLVIFANHNPDEPIIIGSLYNGSDQPAETMEDTGPTTWALQGVNGTRMAIDETDGDTIRLSTPGGRELTISDGESALTLTDGANTVVVESSGITIDSSASVTLRAASSLTIEAPSVSVTTPVADFSGMITCNVLQTNTVISSTYTPGAGNVW